MPRSGTPEWLKKSSFTGDLDGMYAAIRDDNIVELDRLLATGPALHLVNVGGCSYEMGSAEGWSYPLHFAAFLGNLNAVRSLLNAGADPITREWIAFEEGFDATPLLLAIREGHRAVVKALWDAGASADSMIAPSIPKFNLPRLAAAAGHAGIVGDLLSWKQWDLDIKLSAMEAAARCWRLDVVDELLRPGVYFQNNDLFPTLHAALHDAANSRGEYPDELYPQITPSQYVEQQMLIAHLVDAGADPDFYMNEYTPLTIAALGLPDSLGAVSALLDNGASVDQEDRDGNTAFHIIATLDKWCSPAISLLLDHDASVDMSNRDGVTALQLATQHAPKWSDLEPIFQEYVTTARPVDTFRSDTDETLLHFAALGGKIETMEHLISAHEHDIDTKTKTGWTPLMYALLPKIKGKYQNPYGERTLWSAIRAAKLLLSHGADPLTTTDEGWTPLHVLSLHVDVCPRGKAKALALELISLGCSINPPPALAIAGKWHAMSEHIRYPEDRWQKLPLLHWAALHGAVDIVKALIESGANVFEQDMYNHTAEEVAGSSEFLREHVPGGGPFKELGSVGKMILGVLDEARWRR